MLPQSDEGGGTDLASLVQTLQAEGGEGGGAASVAPKFEKGDRVLVVEGERMGLLLLVVCVRVCV